MDEQAVSTTGTRGTRGKTGTRGVRGKTALIEVPVADELREPLIFRLDMGKLSERHRATLNRMWSALRESHATLSDGRHVEGVPDVVRWLLDQVEANTAA